MPYQGRERKSFSGGNRGFSGGNRSFGGPREMHKVKCSACGKDAEVPFKPKEGLPVYCRECYMKNKENPGSVKPKAQKEEVEEEIEEDSEDEE
ncbi:MAG: CxxC-x17-CxxC domain-containing protein [Candidatus Nanoarchaeia archaeon]